MPFPNNSIDFQINIMRTVGKNISPFRFYKYWSEYKDLPNVLFLHYSDVFKSQEHYIKQVAAFIGVDITESEMAEVIKRTSIDFMKSRNDKYRHKFGKNNDKFILQSGVINKGGVGSGKAKLTESQKQKLFNLGKSILTESELDYLYNGSL